MTAATDKKIDQLRSFLAAADAEIASLREQVAAMQDVVDAAEAMRKHISLDAMNCGDAWRLETFDAALARLEQAK